MEMSKAALPPQQPAIREQDRSHPLFNEYSRWRSSLACQLVRADSFADWLNHRQSMLNGEKVRNHPRHAEYVVWLRTNVNCKPQKHVWISIWEWEKL